MFEVMFPSPTAGDGRVRRPYLREEDGQGGGSSKRRIACAQCGFPGTDLNRVDHSGGSAEGAGAGGATSSGDQTYNTGAGCPMCFSPNSTGQRLADELTARKPDAHRLT